jgi:hypothetical protein
MSDDVIKYIIGQLRVTCWEEEAAAVEALVKERDGAYLERNQLVALLASVYPSGIKRTAIEGWHKDWHGCVYIDFPWGQASWHYHVSQADLFAHLPPYQCQWDGHSTAAKYTAIVDASRKDNNAEAKLAKAVEALRKIAAYTHIGTHEQGIVQNAEARIACTALAELEGK